jgi:hypothetical protein
VVSFNGPCSSGLVCAVCLVPPEVGPIIADPESLAVIPYQRDPLERSRSVLASHLT